MAEGGAGGARGTKAKAEPDAEAPRKVQRVRSQFEEGSQEDQAAPNETAISDHRLQMEVQAILATQVKDLGQVTVGQMRTELEQRLGMDGGALGARKQLRRRVSRVLQDEMVKKTGRSADCDRVVRALVEFEAYPAELRQMLIESLPHSLAVVTPRAPAPPSEGEPQDDAAEPKAASDTGRGRLHSHQVRLLGIVRDALGEAREQAMSVEAASAARVQAAEAELSACRASCASGTAAEIAARAQAESAEARARDLEKEVEHAKSHLSSMEARMQGASDQVDALQSRHNTAAALRDGPLQALLHGTWRDGSEGDEAVSAVLPYLKEEGAAEALLVAAPAALRKRPNERSTFDSLTARSVGEFVAEQIGAIASKLGDGTESGADADRLAAAAMLRATRARADDQASKAAAARSHAEEATQARRAAEAVLAEHRMGAIELFRELEHLRGKVKELDQVVAMVDSWITSRRLDGGCAAPAGGAAEAPSDSAVANDSTLACHAQVAEQSPCSLADSTACLPAPAKAQAMLRMPASPQKAASGEWFGVESEESSTTA